MIAVYNFIIFLGLSSLTFGQSLDLNSRIEISDHDITNLITSIATLEVLTLHPALIKEALEGGDLGTARQRIKILSLSFEKLENDDDILAYAIVLNHFVVENSMSYNSKVSLNDLKELMDRSGPFNLSAAVAAANTLMNEQKLESIRNDGSLQNWEKTKSKISNILVRILESFPVKIFNLLRGTHNDYLEAAEIIDKLSMIYNVVLFEPWKSRVIEVNQYVYRNATRETSLEAMETLMGFTSLNISLEDAKSASGVLVNNSFLEKMDLSANDNIENCSKLFTI